MSAAAYRKPSKRQHGAAKRVRAHKHDLRETAKLFNEAFDRTFCKTRPHLRYLGAGAFDRGSKPRTKVA